MINKEIFILHVLEMNLEKNTFKQINKKPIETNIKSKFDSNRIKKIIIFNIKIAIVVMSNMLQ